MRWNILVSGPRRHHPGDFVRNTTDAAASILVNEQHSAIHWQNLLE